MISLGHSVRLRQGQRQFCPSFRKFGKESKVPMCVRDAPQPASLTPHNEIEGLSEFLDSLKYDDKGLVTVIVQVFK
jgi:hypothetical protein